MVELKPELIILYLDNRDRNYKSLYQNVNAVEKWDVDTGIIRQFTNVDPPGFLIEKNELYLLIQSTDSKFVAHTDPWNKEKLKNILPKKIRLEYIENLNKESWLHNEEKRKK